MKLSKDGNIYLVDDRFGFADTYVNVTGADGSEFQGTGGRSIRQLNLTTRKLTTIYEATRNRKIMDIAVAKKDKNFKPSIQNESLLYLVTTVSHLLELVG
jgi:hypothetical protein